MGFVSRLTDKEIMTLLQLGDFFDCDSVFSLALLEVMARIRSSQTPAMTLQKTPSPCVRVALQVAPRSCLSRRFFLSSSS
jgi:hypothetical protein